MHVFGWWEEAEYPERTHAYTGRTYKLHTERTSWELNLEPSCCETTVLKFMSKKRNISADFEPL